MTELAKATGVTRRDIAAGLVAVTAATAFPVSTARANKDIADSLADIARGATVKTGRVKLTMPELAENGSAVSTVIEVQSPMSAADHVKTLHILAEKNPQTLLFRCHLGPRAGRARVATNVRLAETQRIVAVAEMSDGSFWQGDANVIVTLAACVDSG